MTNMAQDCSAFLVQNDAANITQQTLYAGVIAERNARVQANKDVNSVQRYKKISVAIDDFNNLQKETAETTRLRMEAKKLASVRSSAVAHQVDSLLANKYV